MPVSTEAASTGPTGPRGQRLLRPLLIVHGVVTLLAAVVLVAAPSAIPATVGIVIEGDDVLLPYLLGAAELAIALLSFGAARLRDPSGVNLIVLAFIVFHLVTGLLEAAYLDLTGFSGSLAANIGVRVVVAGAFFGAWRAQRH